VAAGKKAGGIYFLHQNPIAKSKVLLLSWFLVLLKFLHNPTLLFVFLINQLVMLIYYMEGLVTLHILKCSIFPSVRTCCPHLLLVKLVSWQNYIDYLSIIAMVPLHILYSSYIWIFGVLIELLVCLELIIF